MQENLFGYMFHINTHKNHINSFVFNFLRALNADILFGMMRFSGRNVFCMYSSFFVNLKHLRQSAFSLESTSLCFYS